MKKLLICCSILLLIITLLSISTSKCVSLSNNNDEFPTNKPDLASSENCDLKEPSFHPIVIYIPGFLSGQDKQIRAKAIISQTFHNAKSVNHRSWCDENLLFSEAVAASDKEAKKLASEIANWNENDRNSLILIGHSLGSRVIIRTLNILNSKGVQIRQAILLGAAMDNDDPQIEKALLASKEKVISIVNPTDDGLNYYFKYGESKKSALGTGYVFYRPERLHEIQTDASLEHDSCFYLNCLLLFIDGKNRYDSIVVPQVMYNKPVWMDENELKNWAVVDNHRGWKLLSKKNNGVWDSNAIYRIVDDLSFVRAAGSSVDDIKQSFDKVKKQLDGGLSDGEIISNQNYKVDIPRFDEIVQKKGSSKEPDWQTIRTIKGFDGWRLQQNGRSFRILDPACNVRAYKNNDKENQMINAFNKLEKQLFDLYF